MAMKHMPGVMFVVNSDLKIVLVNENYSKYYVDPDNLVQPGADVRDILSSELERGMLPVSGTADESLESRLQSYQSGKTHNFEDRTPDGRYIQLTRT